MEALVVHRGLMPAGLIAEAIDTLREMLAPEGPGANDLDGFETFKTLHPDLIASEEKA